MFTHKLKLYLEREVICVEKEMHGLSRWYHTQNNPKSFMYKYTNKCYIFIHGFQCVIINILINYLSNIWFITTFD
jgi:hypothetical protein